MCIMHHLFAQNHSTIPHLIIWIAFHLVAIFIKLAYAQVLGRVTNKKKVNTTLHPR